MQNLPHPLALGRSTDASCNELTCRHDLCLIIKSKQKNAREVESLVANIAVDSLVDACWHLSVQWFLQTLAKVYYSISKTSLEP
jgi:hypothetical protein